MEKASEPVIQLDRVSYEVAPGRPILSDLTLEVEREEVLILLGRSGSGKTTLLRLINGLVRPTAGTVRVEGISTEEWNPVRLRRRIGYVIQEVGLFPHWTVDRNIGLVPRLERWDRERVERRAAELLRLIGLDPVLGARYPHQLSGGQRQRVGVARALAAEPPLLLMDEPFGALDPLTRVELQEEFRRLSRQLSQTIVFVTHDVREALLLGTRIGVIQGGQVVFLGSSEAFVHSEHAEVKAFVASLGPENRSQEESGGE